MSRGHPAWRFRRGGETVAAHPQANMQTTDWRAMYRLALQGHGLVMVPERYAASELHSRKLMQVLSDYDCAPTASADFRENVWLLYPKTRHRSPIVRAFIDMLVPFVESDPAGDH
jgi:DNA-binding transcriptional LysR family regulator